MHMRAAVPALIAHTSCIPASACVYRQVHRYSLACLAGCCWCVACMQSLPPFVCAADNVVVCLFMCVPLLLLRLLPHCLLACQLVCSLVMSTHVSVCLCLCVWYIFCGAPIYVGTWASSVQFRLYSIFSFRWLQHAIANWQCHTHTYNCIFVCISGAFEAASVVACIAQFPYCFRTPFDVRVST